MTPLDELQIAASLSLQEYHEKIHIFIDAFTETMGGNPLIGDMLAKFSGICISYGKLQVILENTLKDDTENTQKEDKKLP